MRTLRTLALGAVLGSLAGCKPPPMQLPEPDPRGGLDAKEAPMLSDRVKAGTLPELAKRLPSDPLVVTPSARLGLYGGTWRMVVGAADLSEFRVIGGYAPLIRWKPDSDGFEPGLASSWEMDETGTILTLHLRHGVRWSDGEPFTSEDIAYWWSVTHSRDERNVGMDQAKIAEPFWSIVDGKSMTLTTPDAWTVVMHFAGPDRFAPKYLATGFDTSTDMLTPKHYLEQFDPRVNKSLPDFSEFDSKNKVHFNPDRPVLWPWHLVKIEQSGLHAVFERNPYYWMTDTAGRQLPYIDRVTTDVATGEVALMRILAGDVDAQFRGMSWDDRPLIDQSARKNGMRNLRWASGAGAYSGWMFNWSPPDHSKREMIRDVRFRRALSLAVDRKRINEAEQRGRAHEQQMTISPESWHFRSPEGAALLREWQQNYADFDLPRANALLDEMGYTRRDAAGFRLRPDGKRASITLELGRVPNDQDEIVSEGWKAIGVDAILHTNSTGNWTVRQSSGDFDVMAGVAAEMDLMTFPDWVFPVTQGTWHPLEGLYWETRGRAGEPPTGPLLELTELYRKMQAAPTDEAAHAVVRQAIRIHIDQGPFVIGTVADPPRAIVLRDNFRNVPESPRVLDAWGVVQPGASYPETFFFDTRTKAP